MKTTHELICECCEKVGKPCRVEITIDDAIAQDNGEPSWSGACQTCGPRLAIPAALYAELRAQHEEKANGAANANAGDAIGRVLPAIEELQRCLWQNDDAEFNAWVGQQPDKHWAKLDLSALRIGYELGKAARRANGR